MVSNVSFTALNDILGIVRAQLVRPRLLSVQEAGAFVDMLGVEDPLDGLASEDFFRLEPFEIELLFSPLFTPTSQDVEACEPALPPAGMPDADVAKVVSSLAAEALRFPLSFGQREEMAPVSEEVIERYVRLLHLNAGIHATLVPVLEQVVSGWMVAASRAKKDGERGAADADRWGLFSLVRSAVWQTDKRTSLLKSCLEAMLETSTVRLDKVRFLTDFVRSYRPVGEQALVNALFHLVEAYHQDQEHPIYNQQLEHYQGGSIRSQHCGPAIKTHRLVMAHALLADFGRFSVSP